MRLALIFFLACIPLRAQVATSLGNGSFQCNSVGKATIVATATNNISGTATLNCLSQGVNWNIVDQTIDGFGAAHKAVADITSAQADTVFGTGTGQAGLSILRTDGCEDTGCTTDGLSTAQLAATRGAKIIVSWWSPPASWKSNGSLNNGGFLCDGTNGCGGTNHYPDFANLIATQVSNFASNGVTVYAVSPANEPDAMVSYDSSFWTDTEFSNFLSNYFCSKGINVFMPESEAWDGGQGFADTTVATPSAHACVFAYADHDYDGASDAQPWVNSGKHLWMTEVSDDNSLDTSIASGLSYANQIHAFMTSANANAWIFWEITGTGGEQTVNQCLICNGVNSSRLYAIGNFSKFVRPGYVRIDAPSSPAVGVNVSAYKDPVSGNFAIVAINNNGTPTTISLAFNGFTSSTVIPHITSASQNLADLSAVTAGSALTYQLPAQSIATFTGTNGS